MESLLPPCKPIAQLPPIVARITPPPDSLAAPKETVTVTVESPVAMPDPGRSDGTSTPDSSVKGPSRRSSKSHTRDGSKPRSYDTNTVYSPRPFEALFGERAYLAQSLQMHSSQAGDLLRQYFAIGSQLPTMEPGKERRRVVKQQRHLRTKINDAVEQEKAIHNRLGDLDIEIQSRQSWTQASEQRYLSVRPATLQRSYSVDSYWSVGSPSTFTAASPASFGIPTPTTPLNAMSTEFFPQIYFPWQPVDYQEESKRSLETVEEGVEDSLLSPKTTVGYQVHNSDNDNDGNDDEEEEDSSPPQRSMSCDTSVTAFKERRLSLPCLPTVWPEA